jgi:hypothetical protein
MISYLYPLSSDTVWATSVALGVPATRGTRTAAALGRVQTGEVEQEILANMWEDWGLLSAYRFGLWKKAWRARERGSQVGLCR